MRLPLSHQQLQQQQQQQQQLEACHTRLQWRRRGKLLSLSLGHKATAAGTSRLNDVHAARTVETTTDIRELLASSHFSRRS